MTLFVTRPKGEEVGTRPRPVPIQIFTSARSLCLLQVTGFSDSRPATSVSLSPGRVDHSFTISTHLLANEKRPAPLNPDVLWVNVLRLETWRGGGEPKCTPASFESQRRKIPNQKVIFKSPGVNTVGWCFPSPNQDNPPNPAMRAETWLWSVSQNDAE